MAVGTDDTHTVIARSLRGGDVEGGSQRGGVGTGGYAHIDHLVAVEGQVVVPVHPDDGAVVITRGVGDVHSGGGAGGHRTAQVAVVAIEGCCSRVRGCVSHAAESHAGDALAIP